MPKKGFSGGGGAGRMQRSNLDLAGAGIAAGIGGLISYITSQAPEIGERILRNPFPSAPRIDIRSNPLERRRGSSTTMPASDRRRLSITGFPLATRSVGEGIFINPSERQNRPTIMPIIGKDIKRVVDDPRASNSSPDATRQRPILEKQQDKFRERYKATGENAVPQTEILEWMQEVINNNPTYNWEESETDFAAGHDLLNPHRKGKGSIKPTHYVDQALNEAAELVLKEGKEKIPTTALKSGKDYTPILEWILNNPEDKISKNFIKARPEVEGKSVLEAAEALGVLHLVDLGLNNLSGTSSTSLTDEQSRIQQALVADLGSSAPEVTDPLVIRFLEEASKAIKAEKPEEEKSYYESGVGAEARRAYNEGDWETFSKLRGYTEEEIKQFKKYVNLAELVEEKYGNAAGYMYPEFLQFLLKL